MGRRASGKRRPRELRDANLGLPEPWDAAIA